jgi:hypothetical protein
MIRWTRTAPALVLLTIAGLMLGPGASAWGATKKAPKSAVVTARVLLSAQDTFEAAQSDYSAKRYADCVSKLEPVIKDLGETMSTASDRRLREEACDLFKRCG